MTDDCCDAYLRLSRSTRDSVTSVISTTIAHPALSTMRQRVAAASQDGDLSSSSSTFPTTRQRSFETHRRPRRSHPPRNDHEPTLLGSVAKLVRLVVLALILALVVPYAKTYLFGNTWSTEVVAKNATLHLDSSKHPYHHAEQQQNQAKRANANDEVDVFNFKHQDYLSTARRDAKAKLSNPVVATASPAAAIAKPNTNPKQQQQQQQQKQRQATTRIPKSRARRNTANRNHNNDDDGSSDDDHDDDDDDNQNDKYYHNQDAAASNTIIHFVSVILSLLSTAVLFTLGFATVPLMQFLHICVYLASSIYHYLRLSLSHMLRPIVHVLAPLTYLMSGIMYMFVQTPYRLISTVARELYPVYIFLGAASVVGISMGLAAAAILYVSAFLFVDRVEQAQHAQIRRIPTTKSRSMAEHKHPTSPDQIDPNHYAAHQTYSTLTRTPGFRTSLHTSHPESHSPSRPYRNTSRADTTTPAVARSAFTAPNHTLRTGAT